MGYLNLAYFQPVELTDSERKHKQHKVQPLSPIHPNK